jgi:hypothetical protein
MICMYSHSDDTHSGRKRRVSEGAAAALLRQDLVNWEFNPFAADAGIKCGMVEAMFHRLGLSKVLLPACRVTSLFGSALLNRLSLR